MLNEGGVSCKEYSNGMVWIDSNPIPCAQAMESIRFPNVVLR